MTVTLTSDGAIVDGRAMAAELLSVPGSPLQLLRVGTRVHELVARRGERRGLYTLIIDGVELVVEALDERAQAVKTLRLAAAGAPSGPEPLRAPMPGLVTKVLVKAGDSVRPGDSLVVMEAMKMENELRARAAAPVRAVHATVGSAVEKGSVLIEFG
jgi:pyruvate carboxylase subunit B